MMLLTQAKIQFFHPCFVFFSLQCIAFSVKSFVTKSNKKKPASKFSNASQGQTEKQ